MAASIFDIFEDYTDDNDDSLLDSFTERPEFDTPYNFETGSRYGNSCVRLYNGSVCYDSNNGSDDDDEGTLEPWPHNHWTLVLLIFPIFTVFGNVLVVLSVYREKTLQTVTNYFIVSLAIADIMVAILVMPLAVYVEVNNGLWELGDGLCDTWVALDVMCCTASILNLAAISVDRFIAVTQPIKYAKHKNSNRVYVMLALSWVISITISSPIALGMNYTERRTNSPYLCTFYNSDFLIYSSMGSFYIPCIVMVLLYWRIFHAIRQRARKASSSAASSQPKSRPSVTPNSRTHQLIERELLVENRGVRGGTTSDATSAAEEVACRTELLPKRPSPPVGVRAAAAISSGGSRRHQFTPVVEETSIDDVVPPMNCVVKTSRSIDIGVREDEEKGVIEEEEEEYGQGSLQNTPCRANGSSSGGGGGGVFEGSDAEPFASIAAPRRGSYWRKGSTSGHALAVYCPPATIHIEHCNQVEHDTPSPSSTASKGSTGCNQGITRPPPPPHPRSHSTSSDVVAETTIIASPSAGHHQAPNSSCCNRGPNGEGDGVVSIRSCSISNHRRSRGGGTIVTKFNFRLRRETSGGGGGGAKKKERSSQTAHKRERKATKTLAIVLGVFLLCWVPFFTINIMNAICIRYDLFDNHRICQIDPMLFSFFVWLGYMNSFLNPVIYTIFNMEFRRAFKNLLTARCKWR